MNFPNGRNALARTVRTAVHFSVAVALLVSSAFAADPKPPVIWQHSTAPTVKLGIREKWGTIPNYKATFLVEGPEGLSLTATIQVRDSMSGYVTFPDDFERNWAPDGAYKWSATVNGKQVVFGRFEFFTRKNGDRYVTNKFSE